MAEPKGYEILSKAYRNPTKLSVILLLTENDEMTVTQMAKYIDVSRSNLYHFVSQLVEDGILNKPDVRPRKNYVEKYYSLNTELFRSFSREEWIGYFQSLSKDDIRDVMSSVIMTYSIQLRFMAENIAKSDDTTVARIREWVLEHPNSATYSALGPTSAKIAGRHLDSLLEDLIARSREENDESLEGGAMLLTVFLPFLLRGVT